MTIVGIMTFFIKMNIVVHRTKQQIYKDSIMSVVCGVIQVFGSSATFCSLIRNSQREKQDSAVIFTRGEKLQAILTQLSSASSPQSFLTYIILSREAY